MISLNERAKIDYFLEKSKEKQRKLNKKDKFFLFFV